MGRGRMAVLSIGILGACSLRPAPASAYGEPQIIDHAEQFSAQSRDGTNCTWAVSFSWDVWNNTQAPYALTSVAYRGFWEIRDGPNDYYVPVTVDDASSALLTFEGGARGVLEVARTAVRRPCDFTVEINGDAGTLVFEYPRLNELLYGDGSDDAALYGMRRIRAEHESHPYARHWWPIGQGVGYGASFVNHLGDLLERWPQGPWEPDFAQGAAVQAVCESIERAAAEKRWVALAEVTGS